MIVETALMKPTDSLPEIHQVYNGLDSCLTLEIFNALSLHHFDPIYSFERAMQAPLFEAMMRGWKIDRAAAIGEIQRLTRLLDRLDINLQKMAEAFWDNTCKDKSTGEIKSLNAASPVQLKNFLYEHLHLPVQYKVEKGIRKPSTDRDALENLDFYLFARPILNTILLMRDLTKQREVFQTDIDKDGRMRTSFNIAGTKTGRLSSSSSSEDTGRNLQNIDETLRHVFTTDPGYILCGIDLEQAESREVGWLHGILFDDWRYLDAIYSGDIHTQVARYAWPDLPWTGNIKEDKALAEMPFYNGQSRRFLSKKLGHGSNYYGQPPTLAKHAKIPLPICQDFHRSYFGAFPAFPQWHEWVIEQLATTQSLTTPWGRTRHFFGRPDDASTHREAIAYSPQSSTADRMNLGMWRVWKYLPQVKLLAQVHDAIYALIPDDENKITIAKQMLSLIDIPMRHIQPNGEIRELIVPGEMKLGYNWGSFASEEDVTAGRAFRINLEGLKKVK